MDRIMKYFVEEKKVTEMVAKVLMKSIIKYMDIKSEFIYWIENRNYDVSIPVEIQGYTAKKISELAPHLDGAGVYNFMITLRETPEKAQEYIKKGFPRK